MFRRIITRSNFKTVDLKKVDWKLENLNDRVLSCQTQIDSLYLGMRIFACFGVSTIFIKTAFQLK